jgi:hypothetical protein
MALLAALATMTVGCSWLAYVPLPGSTDAPTTLASITPTPSDAIGYRTITPTESIRRVRLPDQLSVGSTAAYGSAVVISEYDDAIDLVDLDAGTFRRLVHTPGVRSVGSADIDRGTIVWSEWIGSNEMRWTVLAQDLETGQRWTLGTGSGDGPRQPVIAGRFVAWDAAPRAGSPGQIEVHALSDGHLIRSITAADAVPTLAVAADGTVTYVAGPYDSGYFLSENDLYRSAPGDAAPVRIDREAEMLDVDGDRVVWQRGRPGRSVWTTAKGEDPRRLSELRTGTSVDAPSAGDGLVSWRLETPQQGFQIVVADPGSGRAGLIEGVNEGVQSHVSGGWLTWLETDEEATGADVGQSICGVPEAALLLD